MISLALSLGHNSSAILLEDGHVKIGYEEERLTGVKSEGAFPELSILEIGKYYDLAKIDTIVATHWDTFGDIHKMGAKYWKPEVLAKLCPKAVLWSHDSVFTHHDAHMFAANKYSGMDDWTMVVDGFGNFNEVMSIYKRGVVIHRAFGYNKSLGLLYQYATAFLGMKMLQDEYKLLGYEAHADKLSNEDLSTINMASAKLTKKYFNVLMSREIVPEFDALCNIQALPALRSKISSTLAAVTRKLSVDSVFLRRVAVAVLVQSVVENVLVTIVQHFGMDKVTLTGGVFYNVKVNNAIMKVVDKISVCPLAGDQGAGLGVYEYYHGDLVYPQDLCFGRRNLSDLKLFKHDKFKRFDNEAKAKVAIQAWLQDDYIVNIVRGDMEFGPRALGNTTTLMKPTMANVEYINHLNGRSTIMPCAPITTDIEQFKDHQKVVKSLSHMIITLDYKSNPKTDLRGAAHKYPFSNTYSGRPQLIDSSHWLYSVVNKFGTLVNTSYNAHGSPILFTAEQVLETFDYQAERDVDNRMVTIVIM